VESSRGPLARRLRFSLASLLPLILHSFALSLGLRVASFGDASPGPVVCDEVVAAGLLLCTAMEIFFSVITWSGQVLSRLVCRIRACRRARVPGAGWGVDLVGAAVFLGPAPLLGSFLYCCFSTECRRLCSLRLDLVGRGWCLT
jgi:hypothetical protein